MAEQKTKKKSGISWRLGIKSVPLHPEMVAPQGVQPQGLGYGVMVAQDILVVLVLVRTQVAQPIFRETPLRNTKAAFPLFYGLVMKIPYIHGHFHPWPGRKMPSPREAWLFPSGGKYFFHGREEFFPREGNRCRHRRQVRLEAEAMGKILTGA